MQNFSIFSLQKNARYFLPLLIVRSKTQNKYNNDNNKIKKSIIAHISDQFVLLLIAAVGEIKVFFGIQSFARTGTCFAPPGHALSHFSLYCLYLLGAL